ncbi:hypothetical protein OSB04_013404 [Centaurea solstitialis]|uniref:Integrase catalytic domain-containing protein n=1 Tax=Centaurea solstitialis TaxID=347529 RepID=A0AA38TPW6_9ASTR|nr:hypothetical protein OSB04_013404 [Centaurea solstitialis]
MNKLVKGNLVRGLPAKEFSCDDQCVSCLKGKQHKSTHKSKEVNTISAPLQLLHMDLFGPTNVMSIAKGIERQYSAPRTPQQNGVAERKNKTLIEAARTMLVDSKLPITFWAEAVNTACYVQNMVLIVKSKGKTPYELFEKKKPFIGFLKPFGCPCTILNTKSQLGKFDSKSEDGFLVGYSSQSKALRVLNSSSRIIEESDNVECNKNTPNVPGTGPNWLFDIDSLTNSLNMSYAVETGSSTDKSKDTSVRIMCETVTGLSCLQKFDFYMYLIFILVKIEFLSKTDGGTAAVSQPNHQANHHKTTSGSPQLVVAAGRYTKEHRTTVLWWRWLLRNRPPHSRVVAAALSDTNHHTTDCGVVVIGGTTKAGDGDGGDQNPNRKP